MINLKNMDKKMLVISDKLYKANGEIIKTRFYMLRDVLKPQYVQRMDKLCGGRLI